MVYHKQASVASVMYKYLIRFLKTSAVLERCDGRGTLVKEDSSAGPLHLSCGDEWDWNGDQEEM